MISIHRTSISNHLNTFSAKFSLFIGIFSVFWKLKLREDIKVQSAQKSYTKPIKKHIGECGRSAVALEHDHVNIMMELQCQSSFHLWKSN